MERCIDISKHQTAFDAAKCKSAGVSTVVCRLAYSASRDTKLKTYAAAAIGAGLKLGGYGFGTWHYKSVCGGNVATARAAMQKQVNAWIGFAKEAGLNTWFAIDQELEGGQTMALSQADNTALLVEASQMIEAAGFKACLYASASWIMARVNLSTYKYPIWVAYYKWYGTKKNFDNTTEIFPANTGTYGRWMNQNKAQICMWQFTSEGYASDYGCTHGSNGLDKNWLYFHPEAASTPAAGPAEPPKAEEFDEYAYFPMDVLRVTQGVGVAVDGVPAATYSHKGRLCYDLGGADTGKSPVYAPFSCIVKRVYNGSTASSKCNFTWYANTKRVKALNGKIYAPGMLIFETAHCDDANMKKYGIKVGAQFAQGEICGYEGNAGGYASHCHITFGEGPFTGTGWYNNGYGYEINNSILMHKTVWLRPECKVLGTGGYPWTVFDGKDTSGNEPHAKPEPDKPEPTGSTGTSSAGYFPKYSGNTVSIVAALKAVGAESSYNYRAKIAAENGITGYRGTAAQNTQMLGMLKNGTLKVPGGGAGAAASNCYPKCSYTGVSIVAALNSIGVDSSYNHRSKIAKANGITGYRGTAAQNTQILNLLKQGKLIKA